MRRRYGTFARNNPGLIDILDKTGFKGISEYFKETSHLERVFLTEAIKEFNQRTKNGFGNKI